MRSVIIGSGSYLPKKVITNEDLSKFLDTNDEWIFSRTGIKQRHVISEGEVTSDLAFEASREAIKSANISPSEIDLIIICTTSPDLSFPSTAVALQSKLGLKNIPAFDLQAVCSGFIYGLKVADAFIRSNSYKTILLVGAESMSKLVDWNDRNTCVLFGDGAGAIILRAKNTDAFGIIDCNINADGNLKSILHTDGGIAYNQQTGYTKMLGKEVFKAAVERMSNSVKQLIEENKFTKEEIDWIIPHQANARIIEAISTRLDFSMDKMVVTLQNQANTSAATIGLALDHQIKAGRIRSGDLIIMTALGAGLTWGGCLLRWQ